MSIVYVTHEPLRRDKDTHEFSRMVDLSPAREFGEIVTILPAGKPPYDIISTLPAIRTKLRGFTREDFILPLGHPILIGWCVAIASAVTGGHVRILYWRSEGRAPAGQKQRGHYEPVAATLWSPAFVGAPTTEMLRAGAVALADGGPVEPEYWKQAAKVFQAMTETQSAPIIERENPG